MTDNRQTLADALAACTGSRSVTVIDERRNADGSLTELGRATSAPAERVIVADRDETDACEAGTPGCCIDHNADRGSCETW